MPEKSKIIEKNQKIFISYPIHHKKVI